jgi:hypothetical protein
MSGRFRHDGVGRSIFRHVRPSARRQEARRIRKVTRAREQADDRSFVPQRVAKPSHEVSRLFDGTMRCPCGWRGPMIEAVGHTFGGR